MFFTLLEALQKLASATLCLENPFSCITKIHLIEII